MKQPLEKIASRHVDRIIRSGQLQESDRRLAEREIWRMVASGEAEVINGKLFQGKQAK